MFTVQFSEVNEDNIFDSCKFHQKLKMKEKFEKLAGHEILGFRFSYEINREGS